jgi:hypothetical protein
MPIDTHALPVEYNNPVTGCSTFGEVVMSIEKRCYEAEPSHKATAGKQRLTGLSLQ